MEHLNHQLCSPYRKEAASLHVILWLPQHHDFQLSTVLTSCCLSTSQMNQYHTNILISRILILHLTQQHSSSFILLSHQPCVLLYTSTYNDNELSYFHCQALTLPSKKTSISSCAAQKIRSITLINFLQTFITFSPFSLSSFPSLTLVFKNPSFILIPKHLNTDRKTQNCSRVSVSSHDYISVGT